MEGKYYMSVGMQLNIFHASKLFVWLNYVRSPFRKEKYALWNACNTRGSFEFLPKFVSGFGLVKHVRCHQMFTSFSIDMAQSRAGHVQPW
jgi:hypothetical protein